MQWTPSDARLNMAVDDDDDDPGAADLYGMDGKFDLTFKSGTV